MQISSRAKNSLYFVISCIVCYAVLNYIFTRVSLKDIGDSIRNADARLLLVFLVMSFSMSTLRTWRYLILLKFSGHHPHPLPMFFVVLVRNFCSDLLPARLGSLIYVFLLTTKLKVPLDQSASSFSLALLFDVCSIAPMVLIAVLFLGESGEVSVAVVSSAAVGFALVSFLLIFFMPFFIEVGVGLIARLSIIPQKAANKIITFLRKVKTDIKATQQAGLYGRVFVLSILIRVFKYAGLYFILYALLAPAGYTYEQLPWAKVFFGLIVPEFVASLPISGIAGFGAYQSAWIYMFQLLGFPEETAQITSLSHHMISQAYGFLIGVSAITLLFLPFMKRLIAIDYKAASNEVSAAGFFIKLSTFLICVLLLSYIIENGGL